MRSFAVYLNGELVGSIEAASYQAAKLAARKAYRVRCDVIG
jgi:hypothetical protein